MTYKQEIVVRGFIQKKYGTDAEYEVQTFPKKKGAVSGDIEYSRTCKLVVKINDKVIAESDRSLIVTEWDHLELGILLATIKGVEAW